MDFAAQLKLLKAAQGDPARLALASVDLLLSARPAEERERVRLALEVAAVVHWFDEKILVALLEIPEAEAVACLVRLRELTVVEPFPARGPGVMNVHETARLAIRASLRAEAPERLRALSVRAHAHFATNTAPHAVVEALYHRFTAEPEDAARECGSLFERWDKAGQYESLLALGVILDEILGPDQLALPAGLVRGTVLYNLGYLRWAFRRLEDRLETAAAIARAALAECAASGVDWCAASAHDLLGNVLRDQNDPDAALTNYRAALKIRKARAKADPTDTPGQRSLSIAHNKVGEILKAKGELSGALDAFRASFAIAERLANQAPDDADLQRDLSVSHKNVGEVVRAQPDLASALVAFRAGLHIAERLAAKEPRNSLWQRDLSVSHEQIGDALLAKGDVPAALATLRAGLAVRESLAHQYPTNAGWQLDLAWSCGSLANALLRLPDDDRAVEARGLIARGRATIEALGRAHPLTPHEKEVCDWLERLAAQAGE